MKIGLLAKCQEMQRKLIESGDCKSVDISCCGNTLFVTLVKKFKGNLLVGYLRIDSSTPNFETRIDYLIKHGHDLEIAA